MVNEVIVAIITIYGWILFALWSTAFFAIRWILNNKKINVNEDVGKYEGVRPLITVALSARNEEDSIGKCLASILSSGYPYIEVIAVDDRSEDSTGEIMDTMASSDERLKVIHVNELPEGWLGKCHGLHAASMSARGEYIVFTDGDVMFEKHAVSRAVEYSEINECDHLCLIPSMNGGTVMEDSLVTLFGVLYLLGARPWAMSATSGGSAGGYAGVGAFNMVRRSVYEKAGGHVPIRFDVLDDFKLGKLLMRSGAKVDLLLSCGLVSVRWQKSLRGLIDGLEKNGFASMDYSVSKLFLRSLALLSSVLFPYVGLLYLSEPAALGFALSLLPAHAMLWMFGSSGWRSALSSMLFPVSLILLVFAFWRSAVLTLCRGGVMWRDTTYSLEKLRHGMYR